MTIIYRSDAMERYDSYDEQIVGPIVFPLVFAIIAQAVVYGDLLAHRLSGGRTTLLRFKPCCRGVCATNGVTPARAKIETPILLVLLAESVFGFFCIIQCSLNYTHREYFGLKSACHLQAVYAGYYAFAGPSLTAFSTAVCVSIFIYPSVLASRRRIMGVVAAGLLLHAISLVMAALPLMTNEFEFMFAVDFCMPNIETRAYGSLVLVWFVLCFTVLVATAVVCCRRAVVPPAVSRLVVGLLPYMVLTWSWFIIIAVTSLAQGPVVTRSWGNALYAPMALFLHTNQLAIPLFFGGLLRSHLYHADASREAPLKIKPSPPPSSSETSSVTTPAQGAVMSTDASLPPSPPGSECGDAPAAFHSASSRQPAPYVV